MNNHLVHAQQDGLFDWPYKVRSQVMNQTPLLRSAVQMLLLFTCHHGGQASAQHANSGVDATATPVSSEVDERQSIGRLAAPLLMQKREASAVPARICHSTGESYMSSTLHIRSAVRPVAIYSHKGTKKRTGETYRK